MSAMKKKRIKVILITIVIGIMISIGYIFSKQLNQVDSLIMDEIQMSQVEDGIYIGETETILVKVKVKIEVKDSKIENILILNHQNGLGSKAEKIIEDMIKQNRYDVDIVSGATISSKVIKSAVFNGLQKGIKQ